MICVFGPSMSGFQCLPNICGEYAAEHETAFNLQQNNWCICYQKYIQPPSNVFLNSIRVQFFDKVKYLGASLNASLKDGNDIQRQVISLYCAANKLRGTFAQCSTAVKTTLFRLYCTPIVKQTHTAAYETLTSCLQQCLPN